MHLLIIVLEQVAKPHRQLASIEYEMVIALDLFDRVESSVLVAHKPLNIIFYVSSAFSWPHLADVLANLVYVRLGHDISHVLCAS